MVALIIHHFQDALVDLVEVLVPILVIQVVLELQDKVILVVLVDLPPLGMLEGVVAVLVLLELVV